MAGSLWNPTGGPPTQPGVERKDGPALFIREKHIFERPGTIPTEIMFSLNGTEICLLEHTVKDQKSRLVSISLASGDEKRAEPPLRLLELATGRKAPLVPEGKSLVAFHPDGKRYLTRGGTLKNGYWVELRETKDGDVLKEFHHQQWARGPFTLSRDGKMLASADRPALIHVSDVESGKVLAELKDGHGGTIRAISFDEPHGQIATLGGRVVQIWDLKTAKALRKLEFTERPLGMAYSPNGKWLAIGTSYGADPSSHAELTIFDARTAAKLATLDLGRETWPSGIAINPAGNLIAGGTGSTKVHIWEISEKPEPRAPPQKDSLRK